MSNREYKPGERMVVELHDRGFEADEILQMIDGDLGAALLTDQERADVRERCREWQRESDGRPRSQMTGELLTPEEIESRRKADEAAVYGLYLARDGATE